MNLSKFGLQGAEQLSRAEMKGVMGGLAAQGCCAHTEGWTSYQCGYSSLSEAQDAADQVASEHGVRTFYCCDSC